MEKVIKGVNGIDTTNCSKVVATPAKRAKSTCASIHMADLSEDDAKAMGNVVYKAWLARQAREEMLKKLGFGE